MASHGIKNRVAIVGIEATGNAIRRAVADLRTYRRRALLIVAEAHSPMDEVRLRAIQRVAAGSGVATHVSTTTAADAEAIALTRGLATG